ncbi:MAG: hypothetical protein JNN15_07360 [Blastocatellia bacterium]|nr:hypothetical protein [Blastocatellia bacterium]
MFKQKSMTIICVFLVLLIASWSFTAIAMSQNRVSRSLEKKDFKNEPVEIGHISSKSKHVKFNQEFFEDDDWLNGLAVEVKNVSGKSIVCFEVYIEIPEGVVDKQKYPIVIPLKYGYYPEVENPYPPVPKLQNGDSMTLTVPYEEYSRLVHFMEGEMSKIKKAKVYIYNVYFDDGTAWQGGFKLKPGKNPGEWEPDRDADKTESSKLPKPPKTVLDVSDMRRVAYVAGTTIALDVCKYTHAGQKIIECCGALVPDVQFIPDPAYGNSNTQTITRLCGALYGYSICYYHLLNPCTAPDPPQY